MFLDRSGREVKVGDFIVYGHALGRSAGLQFGQVLSIAGGLVPPAWRGGPSYENWKIRVQGIDDTAWRGAQLRRPGTLNYPSRIILANDFIPENLKTLLLGATNGRIDCHVASG